MIKIILSPVFYGILIDVTNPFKSSWERIVLINGRQRNFVTPAKTQSYQGPCIFSFTSAIESKAKTEGNNWVLKSMSLTLINETGVDTEFKLAKL